MNCLLMFLKQTSYVFCHLHNCETTSGHTCGTQDYCVLQQQLLVTERDKWTAHRSFMPFPNYSQPSASPKNRISLTRERQGGAVFAFVRESNKRHVLLHNLSTAEAFQTVWQQIITKLEQGYRLIR